ncbi:hypothetical protein JW948_01270 [bacterium]|nr:hypothetical protein [bacterium]
MKARKVCLVLSIFVTLFPGSLVQVHAADPCGRDCLEAHIDQVLDAMIAHDPNQLILAFAFFDHNAAVRRYPLPDGTMTPNILSYPQTTHISELFQIRDGKIDQIEAVINSVPYGMRSELWNLRSGVLENLQRLSDPLDRIVIVSCRVEIKIRMEYDA